MTWIDSFTIKGVVLIAMVATILSFANHNYGGVALGILFLAIYLTIGYFTEQVAKGYWRSKLGIKCIVSDFDYTLFLHDSPSETRKTLPERSRSTIPPGYSPAFSRWGSIRIQETANAAATAAAAAHSRLIALPMSIVRFTA